MDVVTDLRSQNSLPESKGNGVSRSHTWKEVGRRHGTTGRESEEWAQHGQDGGGSRVGSLESDPRAGIKGFSRAPTHPRKVHIPRRDSGLAEARPQPGPWQVEGRPTPALVTPRASSDGCRMVPPNRTRSGSQVRVREADKPTAGAPCLPSPVTAPRPWFLRQMLTVSTSTIR